uniref:F-box/LRR-repeat protein 15/At3g58940/PEG3-like LRR domain-containing protein n=1 Tax=Aegilops tauschii TaxID=37682 RepID=M8APX7_AEGTA
MDAARTAALASRWRHLWRSTPLQLIDADLPEPARDAVVPRVLADHPGPFRAVLLTDCRPASLDRELREWPRLLAAKGTQELALMDKPTKAKPNPVSLPADILRCASLEGFLLDFWTLPVGLSRGADTILPHLRNLGMIRIDMSDEGLDHLLPAPFWRHSLSIVPRTSVSVSAAKANCA